MSSESGADKLVVAVDQGTSSTKALVVDSSGVKVSSASVPLSQNHPQAGWVEQDANEILASVVSAVSQALEGVAGTVVAVGLSTQRESAVMWDKRTGEPLGPVLSWQDRRTAERAKQLADAGYGDRVRHITGLPIDPMFSALKFAWLLDDVDPHRMRAAAGEIALGTVDSWIVYKLTGEHRSEVGNASRTMLLDLRTGTWDDSLLDLFDVPRNALPRVAQSNEPTAPIRGLPQIGEQVAIGAVLADSHAALYGHGVREPGTVKVTYGTGSSVLGLLDDGAAVGGGLVRTIAWGMDENTFACEGNVLHAGSTAVWLANVLSKTPSELAQLALTVDDSLGVTLVPAFAGLGAPWWDDAAQGLVTGLTMGTDSAHLAYAAFESIAFQVEDVLTAMDSGAGGAGRVSQIFADGGPTANSWLMQMQADISQRRVKVAASAEVSALGVAYLAGCSAGLWTDTQAVAFARFSQEATPAVSATESGVRRDRWRCALARSRGTRVSHPPHGTAK